MQAVTGLLKEMIGDNKSDGDLGKGEAIDMLLSNTVRGSYRWDGGSASKNRLLMHQENSMHLIPTAQHSIGIQ